MHKSLAQKSSYRLFLWGILLVPFAAVADAVLDALLFGEGTIQDQLLSPSYHEFAMRILFSIFILAAIYLGMHYLANVAQKESTLYLRNKDLTQVRQDLEGFQEDVLRKLRHTSSELSASVSLLKSQCSKAPDEKVRFFLENIDKACNRLNKQLEMSLALAELPGGELHREQVKLDKLVLDVAEEVRKKYQDRQVEFKIQPWVSGWCDQKMLRMAIYNLFCNAMDSIPGSRQGCIEFGSFNRNSRQVLFVRDNGVGFSETQAKRLFDTFREGGQDLDIAKESIRLATARRIINRHGGQIWAEGISGAGGTIFFTFTGA